MLNERNSSSTSLCLSSKGVLQFSEAAEALQSHYKRCPPCLVFALQFSFSSQQDRPPHREAAATREGPAGLLERHTRCRHPAGSWSFWTKHLSCWETWAWCEGARCLSAEPSQLRHSLAWPGLQAFYGLPLNPSGAGRATIETFGKPIQVKLGELWLRERGHQEGQLLCCRW